MVSEYWYVYEKSWKRRELHPRTQKREAISCHVLREIMDVSGWKIAPGNLQPSGDTCMCPWHCRRSCSVIELWSSLPRHVVQAVLALVILP